MREDKVQKKINRSKTYLLPLLNNYIRLSSIIMSNLHNTYIYYEEQSDLHYFYLVFLTSKLSKTISQNIEKTLIDSPLYKRMITDNDTMIFEFEFPEEHIMDYHLLLKGKFSKIKDSSKQKIILFLEKNFPSEYRVLTSIKYILFKSEKLRKTMEKNLNVKLHKDLELGSKFNLEEETYKLVKLNNNEEKK